MPHTTAELTTAETIKRQIGHRAFTMLGSNMFLGDEKSLTFNVKGCRRINRIRITLTDQDLYRVEAFNVRRLGCTPRGDHDGIQAGMLAKLIEDITGLLTSL